jgi:hypothetical protein
MEEVECQIMVEQFIASGVAVKNEVGVSFRVASFFIGGLSF